MSTTTVNIRIDADLKREVDEVAKNLGLTTAAAFNVFARQFVARRGFPFSVVEPERVPTAREFAEEMDRRHLEMKKGDYVEHDIVDM